MNYNSKRHLELLKHSQNLESLGKYMWKEKKEDFLELCRYQGAVQEHIYWKNRREFALLMENFLNGIIDGEEFSEYFSALRRKLKDSFSTKVLRVLKIEKETLAVFTL